MGSSSFRLIFFLLFLNTLFFNITHSATLVVDGVSKWKDPTVQVGDSIIFQHKYHYNLYIFRNRRAFSHCNFAQATLLSKPSSSSYTWHPSRLGFFYFSFNNGSTIPCQEGQKLAIKVSFPQQGSPPLAAPPLSSGGPISSSPSYPWPFRPRDANSPSPAPANPIFSATSPSMAPEKGGGGMPFIYSNPAVSVPTGDVDSTTIGPLLTSGDARLQVVGLHKVRRVFYCLFFLVLL